MNRARRRSWPGGYRPWRSDARVPGDFEARFDLLETLQRLALGRCPSCAERQHICEGGHCTCPCPRCQPTPTRPRGAA